MRSRLPQIAIPLAICWLLSGCDPAPPSSAENSTVSHPPATRPAAPPPSQPDSKPVARPGSTGVEPAPDPAPPPMDPEVPRSPLPIQIAGTDNTGPPTVDQQRVKAAGLRVMEGKSITIYTDIPANPTIDELPRVFDLAVTQWCDYFDVPVDKTGDWKVIGCLIKDKKRFEQAGLLPDGLPPFSHGYSGEFRVWFYDQPSDYYRRHLLLHEGTHSFMVHFLQGGGPPWYMEGMAELLGTHSWDGEKLLLRSFPQDRSETPYWGRIKLVKADMAAGRGMPLRAIMNYGANAHLKVQAYGWCWAAAAFLDFHPEFQDPFRKMIRHSRDSSGEFSEQFLHSVEDEWPRLHQQWQLFAVNIEYGYDIPREAITSTPVMVLPDEGGTVTLQADRGWQSTGYEVPDGTRLELTASGRFQLATDPAPWISEADGVTARYYKGKPLGKLLAAVDRPGDTAQGLTRLVRPEAIGSSGTLDCQQGGVLYLRINDAPSGLSDNQGQLTVKITHATAP